MGAETEQKPYSGEIIINKRNFIIEILSATKEVLSQIKPNTPQSTAVLMLQNRIIALVQNLDKK